MNMRAFVITGPLRGEVQDVARPAPSRDQAVVDVERVGVCGTDIEFFSGEMSYLHTGEAEYPIRIGHEWAGTVTAVGGAEHDGWLGVRVTGDTMLGCGNCSRCADGRHHVCADRYEIGIRNGWPGALAEQLLVPVSALRQLPDGVDATLGALVEPGGNAYRAVEAAGLSAADRLLVLGPGTIGLLAGQIATARGIEVHLMGRSETSLAFARSIGFEHVWSAATLPDVPFHAVIDASDASTLPAFAMDVVEPGRRVVSIGLAGDPSYIDTRIVALKDVTLVGILGASDGLPGAIDMFASGAVDPRPLVAATVGLTDAADVLGGRRQPEWGHGPKVHVDPRI